MPDNNQAHIKSRQKIVHPVVTGAFFMRKTDFSNSERLFSKIDDLPIFFMNREVFFY